MSIAAYCIAVAGIDKSVDFYGHAFGLQCTNTTTLIDQNNQRLELVAVEKPIGSKPRAFRSIAHYGLTTLTFYPESLDPVLATITKLGGTVIETTRTPLGGGREGVFAMDPDGLSLEIIANPAAPTGWDHGVAGVTDLERSTTFYAELGLTTQRRIDLSTPNNAISKFTGVDGLCLIANVLGGNVGPKFELAQVLQPQAALPHVNGAPLAAGDCALVFETQSPEMLARTLCASGATPFECEQTPSDALALSDPDGVPIFLRKPKGAQA